MKISNRVKIFQKIAFDFETLTDQAATKGMSQESREEYERIVYTPSPEKLTALEEALGFVPVVGESMVLYSGCLGLLRANSKWDYLTCGLLIFLGLFGLSSIAGGKAGIQAAIDAAKKGEYSSLSKICAKLKVGSYAEDILPKIDKYAEQYNNFFPEIDGSKLKSALASVDRYAADLEAEVTVTTREVETASREGVEQSAQAAVSWLNFVVGNARVWFREGTNQETINAGIMAVKKADAAIRGKKLGNLLYNDIIFEPKEVIQQGCSSNVAGIIDEADQYIRIGTQTLGDLNLATHTLLHELGHRYWFRFMNAAQRKSFEMRAAVKKLLPDAAEKGAENPGVLNQVKMLSSGELQNFLLGRYKNNLFALLDRGLKTLKEDASFFGERAEQTSSSAKDILDYIGERLADPTFKTCGRIDSAGLSEIQSLISRSNPKEMTVKSVEDVVNKIKDYLSKFNDEEVDSLLFQLRKKPSQNVNAVSNYGANNVEESFAESFGDFVIGRSRMTQAQIKAFKDAINLERVILNYYSGDELIKLAENYIYVANALSMSHF